MYPLIGTRPTWLPKVLINKKVLIILKHSNILLKLKLLEFYCLLSFVIIEKSINLMFLMIFYMVIYLKLFTWRGSFNIYFFKSYFKLHKSLYDIKWAPRPDFKNLQLTTKNWVSLAP